MSKYAVGPFTTKDLQVIQLKTQGLDTREIAQRLGIREGTVLNRTSRVYKRLGFSNLALLTRWAMANALDVELGPEKPEERPYPGKPVPRGNLPIKLGRMRFRKD